MTPSSIIKPSEIAELIKLDGPGEHTIIMEPLPETSQYRLLRVSYAPDNSFTVLENKTDLVVHQTIRHQLRRRRAEELAKQAPTAA